MINNAIPISAYYSDIIPRGTLSIMNSSVDVYEPVIFSIEQPKNIGYLVWVFHDGSEPVVTQDLSVIHRFSYEGRYLVTVQMFGTGGIMSQSAVNVTVENLAPNAEIALPLTAYEDELITISVGAWNDSLYDNKTLSFQWMLGDGSTKNGTEIQHSWAYAGIYPVTLFVLDDQFAVGYDHKFIQILNKPPEAVIGSDPLPSLQDEIYVTEDEIINFSAYKSFDTPSDFAKELYYFWDFGNGEVARGIEVPYSYRETGIYLVTLTVIDNDGVKDSDNLKVIVENAPPTISLDKENIVLNEGDSYLFTASANDTPTDFNRLDYDWSFGKQGWHATNTYRDNYIGTEFITVSDPEGETAMASINVNVTNSPPSVALTTAYIITNITLRVAGTPGNSLYLTLYENGIPIINTTTIRTPGNPNEQSVKIPVIFDLSKIYNIEVTWIEPHYGDNPCWLMFDFMGNYPDIANFHNFNGNHPETYVWDLNPEQFMFNMPITFEGYVFDPGADELQLEISFDSSPIPVSSQVENTWPSVLSYSITQVPSYGSHQLTLVARDDEGASDSISISIGESLGELKIEDLSPVVSLLEDYSTYEEYPIDFYANMSDYGPNPIQSVEWRFGDGTTAFGEEASHTYPNAGTFLVQCIVSDGVFTSIKSMKVTIQNIVPLPDIDGTPWAEEDLKITFSLSEEFVDTPADQSELHLLWDFGDGLVGTGPIVEHAYPKSGNYTLTLFTTDDNSALGTVTYDITIAELPPVINGPFVFETVEGNTITAEVFVDDSILDLQNHEFQWYLEDSEDPVNIRIFTQWNSAANLSALLVVTDTLSNVSSQAYISLGFLNVAPTLVVSNKIIYGAPQPITLRAYALDSFLDIDNLEFTWYLEENSHVIPGGVGRSSELIRVFDKTGMYTGFVEASDGESTFSLGFSVVVTLDSDGDNIIDEIEIQEGTATDSADTDGDFILDFYEWEIYGTSPISPDTDFDGLYDGLDPRTGKGELFLGTDPLNNDTDHDNLTDGFEVFGWEISVGKCFSNGTQWVHTYNATSNPLLIDSDNDNLTDYEEWYYTEIEFNATRGAFDPLKVDTDEDGDTDWEEFIQGTSPGLFDMDNDGVSDADEIEGYYVTLWNGTSYLVVTNASKADTDDDGFDDLEERMSGTDKRITDATRPDTDYDGLTDSAETVSVERGYYMRENIIYDMWTYLEGTTFEFSTQLGNHATNASLLIGISTDSEDYLSCNLKAYKVGKSPAFYYKNIEVNSTSFFFNVTDITDYTPNYYGTWRLEITINSYVSIWEDLKPAIMLEYFKLQVTFPLDPINPDVDNDGLTDGQELNPSAPGATGWITNPKMRDTDSDGWWDNVETLIHNTNPLSKDTDNDGTNDPADREPLHNLIIEVFVSKAHLDTWIFSPLLAVVVGVGENTVVTEYRLASLDPDGGHYETAIFDMTYYIDVSDKESSVLVHLALWKIWFSNAGTQVFAQDKSYQVGTTTWQNQQSFIYSSGPNWARIRVKTLWLEHTNTIAIHSEGNLHNGHYSSLERVNIIILDVEEAGGLFSAGKNVIIIPTSLYTHTELHATIERSVNAAGVIDMDELPDCLKGDPDSGYPGANFVGVNREEGSVTENVDSLIIREKVPLADAQAILDLLLQNETGYVVNIATKTRAETLGIADDVLDLIPWDSKTYENSAQGKMPKGFFGWLWQVVSGFFKAIWDFFVWIFEIIVEFGLWLIGLFASAVMAAIEAAIKLIILVFVFIIIIMTILLFLIGLLLIYVIWLIFAKTTGGAVDFGLLFIEYRHQSFKLRIQIEIDWYYNIVLDMDLPTLNLKGYRDEIQNMDLSMDLLFPTMKLNPAYLPNSNNFDNSNNGNLDETISTLDSNSPNGYWGTTWNTAISAVLILMLIAIGSIMANWKVALVLAIICFIILVILAGIHYNDYWFIGGLALGCFIAFLTIAFTMPLSWAPPTWIAAAEELIAIGIAVDIFSGFILPEFGWDEGTIPYIVSYYIGLFITCCGAWLASHYTKTIPDCTGFVGPRDKVMFFIMFVLLGFSFLFGIWASFLGEPS